MNKVLGPIIFLLLVNTFAYGQDWSEEARLPGQAKCEIIHDHKVCFSPENRKNIYELNQHSAQRSIENGSEYVMQWPVTTTKMRLPKKTMDKIFNGNDSSLIRRFIFKIASSFIRFKSFKDVYEWMGLNTFPKSEAETGPNFIPSMGVLNDEAMGVTYLHRNGNIGLTFSCAACHSNNLFGVKVVGMTNRFPRANEAFVLGKKVVGNTPAIIYKAIANPDAEDYKMFKETKKAMEYVSVKDPLVLGLDTSLAQVGLSLELRANDEYASRKKRRMRRGFRNKKRNPLNYKPADSKPAVWWNLKYKTRWLSDGSIVSGNPVHTNFLWNEIGRGADLKELEQWLVDNTEKVKELTSYVFNTEAPQFNDFFPGRIDIAKAKRGEKIFLKSCKGCHGIYEKNWSQDNAAYLSYDEKIKTKKVWYHKKTPVIDVGTDPYRYQGMKYFSDRLNSLKISKTMGAVVKPQKGYVPPPLVGIWSRWPYFHNNSVPTLYDVISPDLKRPRYYRAVPSENKVTDFDFEKNGYPEISKIRKPYRYDKDYLYDARRKGMSNLGHTTMMQNQDGTAKFSHAEKLELIEFLKTL